MTEKNPFDNIPDNEPEANPFDLINDVDQEPVTSSWGGAFRRGAERGALPAAAAVAGGAAGRTAGIWAGAKAGAVAGAFVPGLGETGLSEAGGAIIGGLIGGFGGGWAAGKAQDYAISQLPDSWKDPIEEQEKADIEKHPIASFAGGLVPFAVTMSPGAWTRAKLPANATALQRLMAHPATAHLFGGAVQGGMELGQEAVTGDYDWRKLAISTGFGLVFNSPNALGRRLEYFGQAPIQRLFGRPGETEFGPTISQAHDAKVAGPGVTEEVFQGTQEQDPHSEMAAQQAVRDEAPLVSEPEQPQHDLQAIARRMEPDLFAKYDELSERRDAFRQWIDEANNPPDTAFEELEKQKAELEAQLAATKNKDEQRRIRTRLRVDVQGEIDRLTARREAFARGEAADTADLTMARQHLMATDYEMRDLAPQVSAAYLRAADAVGAEMVEPEAAKPAENIPENIPGAPAEAPKPTKPIADQKAFIADDVAKQLIAAGRPSEEAEASGKLIAARYEARAALFRGELGTAEDLYRREGARIAGPGDTITPLKPAPAPAAQPEPVTQKKGKSKSKAKAAAAVEAVPKQEEAASDQPVRGAGTRITEVATRIESHLLQNRQAQIYKLAKANAEELRAFDRGGIANNVDAFMRVYFTQPGLAQELAPQFYREFDALFKGFDPATHANSSRLARFHEKYMEEATPRPERPDQRMIEREAALHTLIGETERKLAGIVPDDKELAQGAVGSIRFENTDPRALIRLMKDADASTFIHESGHDFLEQLKRDAAHELAPDQVKTDWRTVKSYLGTAGGELKTRHHEKFARGFEQYMREGVAPSKALAGVYAKFRNWLLSVYQTLKGLGKPINDDIRGVFDRMLAEKPQRIVITPDVERARSLAALHAEDAAETHPSEAEPAMARVEAEATRHEAELQPEIQHERASIIAKIEAERAEQQAAAGTDIGAKNSASEAEGGGRSADSSRPELVADRGARVQRAVEKLAGSGNAGPEGAGVSGTEQRRDARKNSGNGVPNPRAADVFGPSESLFVDKAGNIRLDTLTTQRDVARAIRDAAAANDDFIGDRRGVITDGQVLQLADALGMDAEKLSRRKLGQAFNAEQIMAARKLLIQSAKDVHALMEKAAEGTDEDVMAYAQAKDRHQMIQAQVAGLTAEAGRALRAFRSIAGQEGARAVDKFVKQATGKTLYQLRQEAKLGAQLGTPQQVSKFMDDARQRNFADMLLEYWINGLISGPATHTTYMIGNLLLSLEKAGPETALAAGIGAVRKAMGREGATVQAGEVGAQLQAARRSLPGAIKASVESFQTGLPVLFPEEHLPDVLPLFPKMEFGRPGKYDENASYHDVLMSMFGLVRGLRDGLVAGAKALAAGGVEDAPMFGLRYPLVGAIPDVTYRGVGVLPVGEAIRVPSRFVASIHTLFRAMNYSMEKAALAYRQAAEEGLEGMAMSQRIAELHTNPTPEMMEKAAHEASELTLMGKGGGFTAMLSRLTNARVMGFPLLKFVMPFVRISSNIIEQGLIQRTPLGLLSEQIRADLAGRELPDGTIDTVAQDKALARIMAGTALCTVFGSLAAQGLVSGSGPRDRNKAAMWRLAGNQPHSVMVDGTWYDLHRLGPLGLLMGMSADLYDVAHKIDEGQADDAAAHLLFATINNILDESFMRGPADLLQAIEDPQRYGQSYIQNFLSSFTPYSTGMSQVARAMDPYSRQAHTVIDAIKRRIPGMSEELFPRRSIWGEPIPNPDALGAAGLTAIYESHVSTDPVNIALLRLGIAPAPVSKHIRGVELSEEQRDDYARIAGRMSKMRLDKIVQSPQFANWPPYAQTKVIEETIRGCREAAAGVIMMKFPRIMGDAVQSRLKKVRGENIRGIE